MPALFNEMETSLLGHHPLYFLTQKKYFLIFYCGLIFLDVLSIQNCPQLTNLSGTNNIIYAATIILSGISVPTLSSFTSLYSVENLWFYRNNVRGGLWKERRRKRGREGRYFSICLKLNQSHILSERNVG